MRLRRGKGSRQVVVTTRNGNIQVSSSNPDDTFANIFGATIALYNHVTGQKTVVLTEQDRKDHA